MTLDRRARVLIADTDPILRRNLSKRLLDAEMFSDCVADGKMALEALSQATYAVVILDLALQQVSSERILDFIAAMQPSGRPVVLVLASRSGARSLDVDVVQIVLRKPCDLHQLSDIVQSCVRSPADARQHEPSLESDMPTQPIQQPRI